MANIKISELNELETRNDEDLLAIVDINNNETKKIKVETLAPENFELYAIADTQPTIPTSKSYYNTTTNKIYTYVGGGVFVDRGEPKKGILYIIFDEQSTYAYNGTTLVSVGGGSGSSDIVIIGDESETTEDTKLLVDTSGTTDTLKYKDNNTFTELQIKALDSMPVGTVVEFNGQASDIPSGWEEVSGKTYVAYELWTNSALTSAFATQTINIDLSNYDYYEIYFKRDTYALSALECKKINGAGNFALLTFLYVDGSGDCLCVRTSSLSETGIYFADAYALGVGTNANAGQNNSTIIPAKIIGYKEV